MGGLLNGSIPDLQSPTYHKPRGCKSATTDLSTSCAVVERPDHHCGDDLVVSDKRTDRQTDGLLVTLVETLCNCVSPEKDALIFDAVRLNGCYTVRCLGRGHSRRNDRILWQPGSKLKRIRAAIDTRLKDRQRSQFTVREK